MAIKFTSSGPPHGQFQDDARYNSGRDTVDFTLMVTDDEGQKPVVCRVSREALADALRESQGDALEWYGRLKDRVHAAVDTKFKAAAFEPDGSILVRTTELNPYKWTKANVDAMNSLSASVVSSTATGFPDMAKASAETVVYITNNFFNLSAPLDVDQQGLDGLLTNATSIEQSVKQAGIPNTYIFQLKQDRDKGLKIANSKGEKAEIWFHYVAGLGSVEIQDSQID